MLVEEILGYTVTPFDLKGEEAWAEDYTQAMETAQLSGSVSDASIPGYGTLGRQTGRSIKHMLLRMERIAMYHQAETLLMKVEMITRELKGELPADVSYFDTLQSTVDDPKNAT